MSDNEKKGKGGLMVAGAIAAAAAGIAYLYGKGGKERREKAKRWMRDIKHDVLERLEEMEEVGKGEYHDIVDTVTEEYRDAKDVTEEELSEFSQNLKRRWSIIAEQAEGGIEDAKEKVSMLRKRLKEEADEMGT